MSAEAEAAPAPVAAEQKPEVAEPAQNDNGAASNGAETDKPANGDSVENKTEDATKDDNKDELKTRNWREKADEDNRRDGRDRNSRGRGRGRGRPSDYRDNIKTSYEDVPESDDPDEIRKQVEFYFSDSNLLQDKFLLTQTGGSENRPVPIKTIHSFKRMRHFQPYSAVVAALKDSEVLDITDDEEIKRKTPLPEGTSTNIEVNVELYEDKAKSRSIYAKGFGEEGPQTQLEIEDFFAPYGPINVVRLRRDRIDKVFKGSVFVEFANDDLAKEFLELENKPKFNGKELKIMSKAAYVDTKAQDIKDGKIRPNDESFRGRGGRGGSRGRGARGARGGRGRGGRGDDRRNDRRDRDLDENDDRDNSRRSGRRDGPSEKQAETGAEAKADGESKKRAAEDDGAAGEAKKSKKDDE